MEKIEKGGKKMKKIKLVLGICLGLLMISAVTLYANPTQLYVHVHVSDFWRPQPVLAEIGVEVPAGFNTLPKGKSIESTIANPAWMIKNGWKTAAKGDRVRVTCEDKGRWLIESTTPNKPFSFHITSQDPPTKK